MGIGRSARNTSRPQPRSHLETRALAMASAMTSALASVTPSVTAPGLASGMALPARASVMVQPLSLHLASSNWESDLVSLNWESDLALSNWESDLVSSNWESDLASSNWGSGLDYAYGNNRVPKHIFCLSCPWRDIYWSFPRCSHHWNHLRNLCNNHAHPRLDGVLALSHQNMPSCASAGQASQQGRKTSSSEH